MLSVASNVRCAFLAYCKLGLSIAHVCDLLCNVFCDSSHRMHANTNCSLHFSTPAFFVSHTHKLVLDRYAALLMICRFFFQGEKGNVLYTGDFRLTLDETKRLRPLHCDNRYNGVVIL